MIAKDRNNNPLVKLQGSEENRNKQQAPNNDNKDSSGNEPKKVNKLPQPTLKPRKKQKVWVWILIGLLIFFTFWLIFGQSSSILTNLDGVKAATAKAKTENTKKGGLLSAHETMYGDASRYDFFIRGKDDAVNQYTYFSDLSTVGNTIKTETNKWVNPNSNIWASDVKREHKFLIKLPPAQPGFFETILVTWLPWMAIMIIAWIIIMKVVNKQQGAMKFGESKAVPQTSSVRFTDVAGYSEVKEELRELVDFLKKPEKYSVVGAKTPKGVLLTGPPGTGKTLFARAVAGEANIPFFSISGSDFVEMFVGVGASRVRALFKNAKALGRALIFIDELDAVGRQRGAGVGGGNDEREQTLNQLLVEMDGFTSNAGIIVIAATNRPDVLDPALRRPGRFDREVSLRLPDVVEREAILKNHARDKNVSDHVQWINISMRTPGFSGAQLENIINEAAILSVRLGKSKIDLDIIDEAIDRVIGGPAKHNNSMSKEEKILVAHHEAGHAIIGLVLPNAQKVQKISIVPRGDAGGYVLMTPKKEKIVQTKNELVSQITSYLGGRAAEEIFFGEGEITTGAYSDIQEATSIARRMVTEFGMSELGPVQYEQRKGSIFLGRELAASKQFSSRVGFEIDTTVRKLIDVSYKEALRVVKENKELVVLFAEALIIKENLNSEDIAYIYKHKKLTQQIIDLRNKEHKARKKVFNKPQPSKPVEKDLILNEHPTNKPKLVEKDLILNEKPKQNNKEGDKE